MSKVALLSKGGRLSAAPVSVAATATVTGLVVTLGVAWPTERCLATIAVSSEGSILPGEDVSTVEAAPLAEDVAGATRAPPVVDPPLTSTISSLSSVHTGHDRHDAHIQ